MGLDGRIGGRRGRRGPAHGLSGGCPIGWRKLGTPILACDAARGAHRPLHSYVADLATGECAPAIMRAAQRPHMLQTGIVPEHAGAWAGVTEMPIVHMAEQLTE
eukprot:2307388-Prymnesium_polylepis.2